MKIKKLSAWILAGALTCTAPAVVSADTATDAAVDQAVDLLKESGIGDLLSDPDKVVDIIISAMDSVGQADVTDEEISSAIDTAAQAAGFTLSDSEKSTLVSLYNKFKNMDLDEEQLREQVHKVYDKLESLGVTKEDVKSIFGKLVDMVKDILNSQQVADNLDIKINKLCILHNVNLVKQRRICSIFIKNRGI